MKTSVGYFKAHPHLTISAAVGVLAAALAFGASNPLERGLVGWNIGVWTYLVWTGWTMTHSDALHLKRIALAQAEGATVILLIVTFAALASLGAIGLELSTGRVAGAPLAVSHALLTLSTVVGSWLMVPTLFSLNYASRYHASREGSGLKFPDEDDDFEPDYFDFLYVSFTIAVASQTSDVIVTTRPMRRLVLLQSVLSFVFNTTILAFTINIAASLF